MICWSVSTCCPMKFEGGVMADLDLLVGKGLRVVFYVVGFCVYAAIIGGVLWFLHSSRGVPEWLLIATPIWLLLLFLWIQTLTKEGGFED